MCVPLPVTTRVTAVPIGDVGMVGAEEMWFAVVSGRVGIRAVKVSSVLGLVSIMSHVVRVPGGGGTRWLALVADGRRSRRTSTPSRGT